MVCVPEVVRLAPRTIVEAQFSIPYTVAAAWIDGQLGMRHFSDEGLQRADVLELAAKVRPYVDAEIDRDWSRFVTPAKVTVQFRDGQTVGTRIDYPKGHPNNMMTDAEFTGLTTIAIGAGLLQITTGSERSQVKNRGVKKQPNGSENTGRRCAM
jgi:2-methylcitrate dehydratase PrpD